MENTNLNGSWASDEKNIRRKIESLLALAERATTEFEAALAAARAAELCLKYNIQKYSKQGKTTIKIEVIHGNLGKPWAVHPRHCLFLRHAVAELFGVYIYYKKNWIDRYNDTIQFVAIGLPEDVAAASQTYEYLVQIVENLLDIRKKTKVIVGASSSNSYRKGASEAIFLKAKELKVKLIEEIKDSLALIRYVQPLIKAEVEKTIFSKAKSVSLKIRNWNAYKLGQYDGRTVDLEKSKWMGV
jgi:hypothetical protein